MTQGPAEFSKTELSTDLFDGSEMLLPRVASWGCQIQKRLMEMKPKLLFNLELNTFLHSIGGKITSSCLAVHVCRSCSVPGPMLNALHYVLWDEDYYHIYFINEESHTESHHQIVILLQVASTSPSASFGVNASEICKFQELRERKQREEPPNPSTIYNELNSYLGQ